ncbi:MAG: hypothetical protein A2015_03115 [Spirochaetes bacterium GWF1_31_7]|nr:MAG: hypothetical protein A2Y30_16575 [Spirochaetes bacterium GWE1_32_154]OHD45302.1 MAG: hypothetical protein A2Y29_08225 [Spirochaetes bacterium GWE2_31_10]OHD50958.1 MAG: hypothetical protein A2015_03115 [Spirochaetes bacterium GWF1_31_7]HBD95578.1 hypothetical protein [Spirochaetia bacterium]HBI37268.1 hypothetical protein [Spirochaetia bacterium]
MKILILTIGTRGDIQVYIGLSQKLINAGHSVTIASSRAHEKLITSFGIQYECIDEAVDTGLINNVIEKKGLKAVKEGIRLLFDGMYLSHTRVMELIPDNDLVIGHGWLGETESDMCNKRFIRVGISPNLAEKVKSKATTIRQKLMINIESYAINQLIIKPYNEFRQKIKAPVTSLAEINRKSLFIPISKVLIDSMSLWNDNTYQSSYWYTDFNGYTLPQELDNMLNNGKKNILINFGSMTGWIHNGNELADIFNEVAEKKNLNVLFIGKNIIDTKKIHSESLFQIDEIPLSSILHRFDACFHHCGLGTTSEILRSGCPSIPVPFIIDQFDWAKRLIKTGSATEILNYKDITLKNIINRLDVIFNDQRYKTNAFKVRETVNNEIIEDRTVNNIERLCN